MKKLRLIIKLYRQLLAIQVILLLLQAIQEVEQEQTLAELKSILGKEEEPRWKRFLRNIGRSLSR
jgi:hypothetical protein